MMEGMYESEAPPLYAFGWVDEESGEVLTPFYIPGGTSFLATGTWDTEFLGLNDLAETEQYADLDVDSLPVNAVFQSYHIMVAMYGLIMVCVILALVFSFRKGKVKNMRWLQTLLLISPVFPFIAIQTGWFTTEVGRQPWVVYPSTTGPDGVSLLTYNGVSQSVSSVEILITLLLFVLVYAFIAVAWVRIVMHFIKQGPVLAPAGVGILGAETDDSDEAKAASTVSDDKASASKGGE